MKFEIPQMEIVRFSAEDVITTSLKFEDSHGIGDIIGANNGCGKRDAVCFKNL